MAALLSLTAVLSCDDPKGPPPLVDSYALISVGAGGPLPGTIHSSTGSVARVTGGTLTLRADSTFELRLQGTRDSAAVSAPMPAVAARACSRTRCGSRDRVRRPMRAAAWTTMDS